eukprot:TRINITY_DN167_c0_g1_i3.p1 TRINITY_DN167_c0_g1~~TRINITY_DN167_c0_g1_i3.p1  ORF type:complete len:614 (+),score=130.17 TRINITY_DN167_c0_g1_i3:78-1844(+)
MTKQTALLVLLLAASCSAATFTELTDWNEGCGKSCWTTGVRCKASRRTWGNFDRCKAYCDKKTKCHGFQSSWSNGYFGLCVWFKYTPEKMESSRSCHIGQSTYVKDPVDCEVSDWSYSSCSSSCGTGYQTRTRTVVQEPMYGGAQCPPLTEVVTCNTQSCGLENFDQLSQWSEVCGKGCGTEGVNCLQHSHWQGDVHACADFCNETPECKGFQTSLTNGFHGWCVWFDYRPVNNGNDHYCHDQQNTFVLKDVPTCEVSEWSEWSTCSVPCGEGTQTRTRDIISAPEGGEGGEGCPPLVETRSCNVQPCDVNCEVSEWSSWSDCDATCGGGSQTRTRTITVDPVGNGAACPDLSETQSCNTDPCPINCVVSEWGEWGQCSVPCGGGMQLRTRTILVEPDFGGDECPTLIDAQPCNVQSCVCEVSEWSEWSTCSAPCGEGTQTRTRDIISAPEGGEGGEGCPPLVETRSCTIQPCDVDCEVSEWSSWSDCDATCGGGSQTRTRTITVDPVGNGAACPDLSETQSCNTDPCPINCVVSEWGEWGQCSVPCGGGMQLRTRTILVEPDFGGDECPTLIDAQPCNVQSCALCGV